MTTRMTSSVFFHYFGDKYTNKLFPSNSNGYFFSDTSIIITKYIVYVNN